MRQLTGRLALIFALGLSAPVSAQSNWVVPGTNPFTGTPEQACSIHVARGTISATDCREAVAMYQRGECRERQLRDGENLDVTFTTSGQHGAERKRVAFGSAIPADDERRTATECKLPSGVTFILPHVCGNWSVPIKPKVCRLVPVELAPIRTPDAYYHIPGFHTDHSACGVNINLPGFSVKVPGTTINSTALKVVCD